MTDMDVGKRRIGPVGTAGRALVGLVFVYLAGGAGGLSWTIEWWDPLVGLVGLPAISVGLGLAARHYAEGPVRLTGPLAICINCLVIVVLIANPYSGPGALLFYGVTLLVAAWWGQPGCEATVPSNLILRRDDQIGCPTFAPLDAWEIRRRASGAADPTSSTGARVPRGVGRASLGRARPRRG
jgi:hypothetical protein